MSGTGAWPPPPEEQDPDVGEEARSEEASPPAATDRPSADPWPERDPWPHETTLDPPTAPPDDASPPGSPSAPADEPPPWQLRPTVPAPGPDAGGFGRVGGEELPVHHPLPHLPASPPRPPEHRSRNPVDRLTRGLPSPLRVFVDWAVTIVGAVAIVLLVKAFVVNPYRIPSSSMETTLHCAQPASGCEARFSDRVLANRFLYHLRDPRRGEIVVFETPAAAQVKCGAGGTFVKRLIALPGETVEVRLERGDGYVYINGKLLSEPYVDRSRRAAVETFGPVKVPQDAYFMMGDNRAQSCDSRVWGSVPRENLIGKVFATYWPPNRLALH